MSYYEVINHSPEVATIQLRENVLGGTEAMAFSEQLRGLAESGIKCVIVDLHDVQLMNSSGLGMLVSALSTMRKFGGKIKFVRIPEKVNSLFKMTHLDSVFEVYQSSDDAIRSI